VENVTAFSSCLAPKKLGRNYSAPDFFTACIKFRSGVIARLTNSRVAEYNHDLKIIGDKGVVFVDECWNNSTPVYIRKFTKLNLKCEKYPFVRKSKVLKYLLGFKKKFPLIKKSTYFLKMTRHDMDFSLGILDMAKSIHKNKGQELDMEFTLHVNEVVLAIEESSRKNKTIKIKTKVSK
jgi:predicted dehydrogenase